MCVIKNNIIFVNIK